MTLLEWVGTSADKSAEQVKVFVQFHRDLGYTHDVSQRQLDVVLRRLTLFNMIDYGEKYLKWKFAHMACRALRQTEFPSKPDWVSRDDEGDILVGGSLGRFARQAMSHGDYGFGWSISQLKKGMPIVSDEAVRVALEATVTALTTPKQRTPVPNDDDHESHVWEHGVPLDTRDSLASLEAECMKTVDELYPADWYDDQPVYIPSISGHFDSKRTNTGALGALVRERVTQDKEMIMLTNYRCPKVHRDQTHVEALLRAESLIAECPVCLISFTRFCGQCAWHPSDSVLSITTTPEVTTVLSDSYHYDDVHPPSGCNAVFPVGLKEPFKVRVITGGPEGRYYRQKYVQKSIHSHLRRQPCCALIGETISSARMHACIQDPATFGPEYFYVSGDYSAATDNLDPALSECIARRIGRNANWHSDWIEEFVDALVNHHIYTGEKKDFQFPMIESAYMHLKKQTWGQLMGSPSSFPVLCIANLALTRAALEERESRRILLRDSGILINGDDIGFVTDPRGYDIWKRKTAAGGLEPSLGKNFCSRDFIVLNSTFFDAKKDAAGHRTDFIYRPYINYGLINCRNENGTPIVDIGSTLCPSKDPRTPGIGSLANDLIRGHPPALQLVLIKRFLKNWKPALDRFCPRGMSYYLPTHLGGLGIPVVGDMCSYRGAYSRQQRVMAAFLDKDPERASELVSTSDIGRSESFSLWRKVSPIVKKLMSKVGYTWTKEKMSPDPELAFGQGSVTPTLLANAYASLTETDVCEVEDQGGEDRYRCWRRDYESLFKHCESTTFKPMTDDQIAQSQPWRQRYDTHTCVVSGPRVDLRKAPNQLLELNSRPRLITISDRLGLVE